MKLVWRNGYQSVAAAGTAEQLTSTAYKAVSVLLQSPGNDASTVGDSSVVHSATVQVGTMISDGTGAAGERQSLVINAPGAENAGQRGQAGTPFIDLSDLYVDVGTNADVVFWSALCLE